jgi:phosphoglycerate dehydrogenase-like enzyme
MRNVYLVWLEWPEKCFRVDAEALSYLKSVVPPGSEVVRAKTRRGFFAALGRATHVITWYFERAWYEKAPHLRVLATPSAGQELLPHPAPDGVTIHHGRYHGEIMSETVAGFMLAWCHGFFARRRYPAMSWPRTELGGVCRQLAGTKAAVVGYGNVGAAIGRKLGSLGVEVAGYRRGNIRALTAGVKDIDWFIMVLPCTTGTDDFLDAALIRRLPRKCVVINVGRGNSVDENALIEALKGGRLAGAYLDVIKDEPSAGDVPGSVISRAVGGERAAGSELPENLVLMPHSSAFSPDYLKRCFMELADDGVI